MVEYIKFMSKRVFLRKTNIGLVLSVLAIVLVVLILNMRTQRLYDNMIYQKESLKTNIEQDIESLSSISKDDEAYTLKQSSIEFNKSFLSTKEGMIDLYEKKDFPSFYKIYKEELEGTLQSYLNSINPQKQVDDQMFESIASLKRNLAYIDYLDEHQLIYEDIEFPIFGISFMVFMSDYILPLLILICTIYILAQTFTLDYAKDINISKLFPIGRKNVFITQMSIGIGTSVFIFLFTTLSTFAMASLLTQNMGLDYPYITMDMDQNIVAIELMNNLVKWISLGVLFFVAVACFMYVISIFIKEDTALFMTGATIVLGVAYLPKFVPALNPIAHLLPTTYMNYVSVIQGNLSSQYGNLNITFQQGTFVLFICIVLLIFIAYVIRVGVFKMEKG